MARSSSRTAGVAANTAAMNALTANLLTVGEETLPRTEMTATNLTVSTGQFRFTYFTARKSETSTQVRMLTGGVAAAATPTLVRIGIYEIDAATGAGTLVAATVNDTTLFAAATTAYTRSWQTPFAKVAGRRYAAGALVVTGATAPNLVGAALGNSPEVGFAPRLSGVLTGLADLPASFVDGSVVASSFRPYAVILP